MDDGFRGANEFMLTSGVTVREAADAGVRTVGLFCSGTAGLADDHAKAGAGAFEGLVAGRVARDGAGEGRLDSSCQPPFESVPVLASCLRPVTRLSKSVSSPPLMLTLPPSADPPARVEDEKF